MGVTKARAYALMAKYGITIEQYDQLLEAQEGKCAICRRDASEFKTRLAVEHDHTTKEIMGLCCTYCNLVVLGRCRDPEIYERAAAYLRGGTGWFVPKRSRKKRRGKTKRTRT
jgi:hypothetical protein